MPAQEIVPIEIALALASLVLGARLAAFVRAERGLGPAAAQVKQAWESGDARATRQALRQLSSRVPFGDFSQDWSAALEEPVGPERQAALGRARRTSVRRVVRRAGRGQALDLTALSVLVGLGSFGSAGRISDPLFWGLGGLLVLLLIGSVVLRGSLGHSVRSTLERVEPWLLEPSGEVLAGAEHEDCPLCGAALLPRTLLLGAAGDPLEVQVQACPSCGHFSGTLPAAFRNPPP